MFFWRKLSGLDDRCVGGCRVAPRTANANAEVEMAGKPIYTASALLVHKSTPMCCDHNMTAFLIIYIIYHIYI